MTPRDVDALSGPEYVALTDYMVERLRAERRAAAKARRGR